MSHTVCVGDVCRIVGGGTPSRKISDYWGGGIPWATVKDFCSDCIAETLESVSQEGLRNSASKIVPAGTVLLVTRVGLGKVAIADIDVAINQDIKALFPSSDVLPEFLFWTLKYRGPALVAKGVGATVKGVTLRDVKELEIFLPPLDEQQRIVAILNRVAKVERLRARAAERLREFVPALFVKMFGREGNREDWPLAKIDDLVTRTRGGIRTGPFGSQLKHSEFVDDGIPVLGIDNVVTNRFRWTKPRCLPQEKYDKFVRYRVYPDDVLITIMGTTGRACVAPKDLRECMSTKHLCVLTLDRSVVEPTYVWGSLLFDPSVRTQTKVHAQGQIMEGWNSNIVRNLRLRIPPLGLQRQYTRIAGEGLSMAAVAESGAGPNTELSASLMERLLGGVEVRAH